MVGQGQLQNNQSQSRIYKISDRDNPRWSCSNRVGVSRLNQIFISFYETILMGNSFKME